MYDTDDLFFDQVELLTEASRIDHKFAAKVDAATTDAEIDGLLDEARKLVLADSEQDGM